MPTATYDLDTTSLGQTPLTPALPRLAAPRYSAADQLREPGKPCTRLVKDVLRTGRWRVGIEPDGSVRWWTVSEATLDQIESSFAAARLAGNDFNLCWGHGDPLTGQVDARDTLYPLDQVFREGDTLWATVYVDLATAAELRKPGRKVSVRIVENWTDGQGQVFPLALVHVALVDQPVLNGQGPFLNLANSSLPQKGNRVMAVTLQPTIDFINELLNECDSGLSIPEGTTDDNFDEVLAMLKSMWDAQDDDDDDGNPEGSDAGADSQTRPALHPEAGAQPPADLASTVRSLEGQVRDLSQQLAEFRSAGAKAAYTARLEGLARSGKINARAVISLTQTGASHGYDLSLLAPFEEMQMVDMQRRAKGLATGQPPAVDGITPDLTQEQIETLAARVAGRKK